MDFWWNDRTVSDRKRHFPVTNQIGLLDAFLDIEHDIGPPQLDLGLLTMVPDLVIMNHLTERNISFCLQTSPIDC